MNKLKKVIAFSMMAVMIGTASASTAAAATSVTVGHHGGGHHSSSYRRACDGNCIYGKGCTLYYGHKGYCYSSSHKGHHH